MSQRDLSAFMRESAKVEEIVTALAPDTIRDKEGNQVMLEIKVLSNAAIKGINDKYTTRVMATDTKGFPYIQNGEVAFKTTVDNQKATGHILAEALVHPNLKDPELMKFFECYDISEMAAKVFPRTDEYAHVNQVVMAALGIVRKPANDGNNENNETESVIAEAKK